jgi:hypothetical protein
MSNGIAEAAEAHNYVRILIDREADRVRCRVRARQNVARAIGVPPGTIENIQRNRLKTIAGWVLSSLRARVIRELEVEIARLQHELAVLHQTGVDPRDNEMAAVRADIATVEAILGRGARVQR